MHSRQFTLADGRNLDLLLGEGAKKSAIVFHHGTPSHATLWNSWITAFENRGIFSFAYSRAGYGTSSRHPDRSVNDVVSDIQEVLNEYGVENFVSVGRSGGGPHALATTGDQRCKGVLSIAGFGEYGAPDLDFLAGMGEGNHQQFGAAISGVATLTAWMDAKADFRKTITGQKVIESLGGVLSDSDKAVLTSQFAEDIAHTFHSALQHGYYGWLNDDIAFVKNWGFDIRKITVPVSLWHGDQDLFVPHAHSEWLLSKIPTAHITRKVGEGHLSLGENCREEIYADINNLLNGTLRKITIR